MALDTAEAGSHPQQSGLGFPAASYRALRGAETLTLALKATECLDGRGAFLHWCDPAARRLRLVAASGLAATRRNRRAAGSHQCRNAPRPSMHSVALRSSVSVPPLRTALYAAAGKPTP
ncbi:hypothetical protein, partial [Streptomyces carpinensis]|uniref:hypothetical protein n=1 Tax=Streptomyces carpinensis TaxID=66369 RepID=UPI001ABF0F06